MYGRNSCYKKNIEPINSDGRSKVIKRLRIDTDSKLRNDRNINPEQKAIMRDLLRVGATSASKFEINTNRISKKTSDKLNALVTKGLIGKTETNIFYPTLQTWLKVYLS